MKLNCKFQEGGGGFKPKNLLWGIWIFSGTTHYMYFVLFCISNETCDIPCALADMIHMKVSDPLWKKLSRVFIPILSRANRPLGSRLGIFRNLPMGYVIHSPGNIKSHNRSFPSCRLPLFQNESWCTTFYVEMSLNWKTTSL